MLQPHTWRVQMKGFHLVSNYCGNSSVRPASDEQIGEIVSQR